MSAMGKWRGKQQSALAACTGKRLETVLICTGPLWNLFYRCPRVSCLPHLYLGVAVRHIASRRAAAASLVKECLAHLHPDATSPGPFAYSLPTGQQPMLSPVT